MRLTDDEMRTTVRSRSSQHLYKVVLLFAVAVIFGIVSYIFFQQHQQIASLSQSSQQKQVESASYKEQVSIQIEELKKDLEKAKQKISFYAHTADKATWLQRSVNKINKILEENKAFYEKASVRFAKIDVKIAKLNKELASIKETFDSNISNNSQNIVKIEQLVSELKTQMLAKLQDIADDVDDNAESIKAIDKDRAIINKNILELKKSQPIQ